MPSAPSSGATPRLGRRVQRWLPLSLTLLLSILSVLAAAAVHQHYEFSRHQRDTLQVSQLAELLRQRGADLDRTLGRVIWRSMQDQFAGRGDQLARQHAQLLMHDYPELVMLGVRGDDDWAWMEQRPGSSPNLSALAERGFLSAGPGQARLHYAGVETQVVLTLQLARDRDRFRTPAVAVLDLKEMLARIMSDLGNAQNVALLLGDTPVLALGEAESGTAHLEQTLRIADTDLQLRLWPEQAPGSGLLQTPALIAALGLLLAVCAGLSLAATLTTRATTRVLRSATASHAEAQQQFQTSQIEALEVMDAVVDGIICYDHEWRFLFLNRAAERIAGRGREQLLGLELWTAYPETVGSTMEASYRRALEARTIQRFEMYSQPTQSWLEIVVIPTRNRVLITLHDITAQRLVEQRLARELAFSRAITAAIADGVFVVDRDERIVYMNPAAANLLGLEPADVIGRDTLALPQTAIEHGSRISRPAHAALESQRVVRSEAGFLPHADGSLVEVAFIASPLRNAEETSGAVVVFREVGAERRARAQLLERDHLFQSSRELFCVLRGRRIVQVNPAMASLCGRVPAVLLDKLWDQLMYIDEQPAAAAWIEQLSEASVNAATLLRMASAAGGWRWIEWTGSCGDQGLCYLVGRDITETVESRAALDRAYAALKDRNVDLQEFASIASHDLQEPLRKMLAFGERLRIHHASQLGPEGLDDLARLLNAALRMRRLIEDLLEYSRVGRSGRPMRPVDLNELVREVLSDLEQRVHETSAEIEIGTLPSLIADRSQIGQVLQNLIGNALKFIAKDSSPRVEVTGEIFVPLGQQEEWCRLQVRDHGIGFDPAQAERLFAPFQRLHSRQAFDGSGIGLALVRRIVQRHGGRVYAQGTPGQGSCFTVELPLTSLPEADPELRGL